MTSPEPTPAPRASGSADLRIAVGLLLATCAVFANGIGGDFVYDDVRQIQQNRLVQDPALLGEALLSDVWAFRGDREESWSQYWRPVFVLWLVANERLFGVEDPTGWHIASVLLHAGTVLLGALLLRRLGVRSELAGAILLLFAVHPVHVESVTWISGSPDPLMALGILGALTCVVADLRRPRWPVRVAGWGCAAFALLAKESAALLPLLVLVAAALLAAGGPRRRARTALLAAAPYAALALLYGLAHLRIAPPRAVPWDPGWAGTLLTAPGVLAFYLRQTFLPLEIGPAYPLRVVLPGEIDAGGLWLPLGACIAAGALALLAAGRDPVRRLGAALFVVPLLPAFYLRAFRQEEIVHDRYLYLPLLGALLVAVPALADLLGRRFPAARGRLLPALLIAAAAALALQTVRANRTWLSAESLWRRAVETAPDASHAWAELANVHYRAAKGSGDPAERARRLDEARRAADRALALFPVTAALQLRGMIARDEGRHDDAIADFGTILAHHPEHVSAAENLAFCLDAAGRTEEAVAALRRAREAVPHRFATWTEKIAVCLHRLGRPEEVLAELESARPLVAAECRLVPEACAVLYRLVQVRAARGESALARAAADEFLRLTEGSADPLIVRRRGEIEAMRARWSGPAPPR